MIYGKTDRSIAKKSVLMLIQSVILLVAVWLLLWGGLETVSRFVGRNWSQAVNARRAMLAICLGIMYIRMAVTMFCLLKRAMGWEEVFSIPFAFALYYVGFPIFAGPVERVVGVAGLFGIVLFVSGSAINTVSEILRDRWKKNPANRGKLYTGGLFRYSMHINYFGDILWVGGLALITGNPWSASIPLLLFCFFAFYNAPLLDGHLAQKYGAEFEAYRSRTKRIIPFLY